MALIFFSFSGLLFAQASKAERDLRSASPGRSGTLEPLDSRGTSPILEPAVVDPERRISSGGGGSTPTAPGEAMDTDSRDIYIYVTLMAPEGPDPPDMEGITSIVCTPPSQQVNFKATYNPPYHRGDYYNVYRDTLPLFFMSQLVRDPSAPGFNRLPEVTYSRFYTDNFIDTLYLRYQNSSKGVCDTLVNLFYVFTTVDTGISAIGGYSESHYPSRCMNEYDQAMRFSATFGRGNWVSITSINNQYTVCSHLDSIGVNLVYDWNPATQTTRIVGRKVGSTWIVNGALRVGKVYQFMTTSASPTLFSLFRPGILTEFDGVDTLIYNATFGGRNMVMIPFRASLTDPIHNRATLETSIEDAGASFGVALKRIERWSLATFTWTVIANETPFGWTGNPRIRPGTPYRIWITAASSPVSFTWPIP